MSLQTAERFSRDAGSGSRYSVLNFQNMQNWANFEDSQRRGGICGFKYISPKNLIIKTNQQGKSVFIKIYQRIICST
jgi:hypothetical protein